MSVGKSKSSSSSKPLTPQQVTGYFSEIDRLSGGRLGEVAKTGTADVSYAQLTPEQLRSIGGAGATRTAAVERTRQQAGERIGADPSLTTFQQLRANQLADQDAAAQIDAISKETEAILAQIAAGENAKLYDSQSANARRDLEDLMALADIYFGGKGSSSSSSGRGFSVGIGNSGSAATMG
jgi:hypothetical protein